MQLLQLNVNDRCSFVSRRLTWAAPRPKLHVQQAHLHYTRARTDQVYSAAVCIIDKCDRTDDRT